MNERRTDLGGGNTERVDVHALRLAVGRVALRSTIEVEAVKPVR